MLPTPYPELNQVLDELVTRMQRILGDDLVGAYLQGSFALGDFDEHSDADFIVVVEDELTSDQVDALQVMHGEVYDLDAEWSIHLEGSYFPRAILRDLSKAGTDIWYLDHGSRSLVRSGHCNKLHVRWIVRERGVVLAGPPPRSLMDPIPTASLRAESFEAINHWGKVILDDPDLYRNRFYQGFIVLNYCRMLHDLHRGYPGSKREGAEWAKSALDPSWSDLIDRAWETRPNPGWQVRQPPDPEDFERTLRFVAYVMEKSEAYVSERMGAQSCEGPAQPLRGRRG
jgi:predicted nucleotidyltransferase